MARILLLGTWLGDLRGARDAIERRNAGRVQLGGLAGQLDVSGPRIEIDRTLIANDRTWQHGMPRAVIEGRVERQTDDLFVVVDESPGGRQE